jgi:hypothetical protein
MHDENAGGIFQKKAAVRDFLIGYHANGARYV